MTFCVACCVFRPTNMNLSLYYILCYVKIGAVCREDNSAARLNEQNKCFFE